jgi:hypothetical protein
LLSSFRLRMQGALTNQEKDVMNKELAIIGWVQHKSSQPSSHISYFIQTLMEPSTTSTTLIGWHTFGLGTIIWQLFNT